MQPNVPTVTKSGACRDYLTQLIKGKYNLGADNEVGVKYVKESK